MATMAVRAPLAPLTLARFAAAAQLQLPSPVSLPTKRAHPPSPFKPLLAAATAGSTSSVAQAAASTGSVLAAQAEAEPSRKVRRLSEPDEPEAGAVNATPRARDVREVLGADELGVGRSPARRLFADGPSSSKKPHVIGLAPSPPIESRRRVTRSVSRTMAQAGASASVSPVAASRPAPRSRATSRTLATPTTRNGAAARPTSSTAAGRGPVEARVVAVLPAAWVLDANGVRRNAHDPGFSVHVDDALARSAALSATRTASLTPSSSSSAAAAPSTPTKERHNDQENVPPTPRRTPHSGSSAGTVRLAGAAGPIRTPASASSASSTSGRTMSDADILASGAGNRTRERSRLGLESTVAVAEAALADDDDELTPGRPKRASKAGVKREVDMV